MVDYAMDLARIRTSFVNNFQELTDSIFSSAATANLDAEGYYFIQMRDGRWHAILRQTCGPALLSGTRSTARHSPNPILGSRAEQARPGDGCRGGLMLRLVVKSCGKESEDVPGVYLNS